MALAHPADNGVRSMTFTISEFELLIEALERSASRLESYGRFHPQRAGPHDRKAAAMRKLRARLMREQIEIPEWQISAAKVAKSKIR
jgi:hypothetical protein